MKRKLSALLIVLTLLFSNAGLVNPVFADDIVEVTQDLNSKISQLPETMLASENVAKTFQQLLDIQEKYNKLSDEEKESVINYSKVEKLLNPNDDSLNTEFVSQKTSSLKGKTIGYLGSSITVGFISENVAFPDYIGKITGSITVKQAITGGPLAKKEGVRDEVSYITQLEDNLSINENLDALVVQLSTNDTTLGIGMGEVSSSQNKDDYDYSTVIGAMEYIIAYAKEKWNCPVIFYINPYLSDEVIEKFAKENNANIDEIKEAYQNTYEKMIDALYKEYLKRVDTQLKAAIPNIEKAHFENGIYFNMIDVEKYAHKFTFPAPGKTCGFVHDSVVQELGEDKPIITLGHGPDFGVIRATDAVNERFGFSVNNIVPKLAEMIPSAGIDGGGHECAGSIKYIEGLGEEVLSEFVNEIRNMSEL